VLQDTLGLGPEVWRILSKCHDMRNRTEYEGALDVDDRLGQAPFSESELQRKVLPMGHKPDPVSYRCRDICRPLGDEQPCFSLGVRVPFTDLNFARLCGCAGPTDGDLRPTERWSPQADCNLK